MLKSVFLLKQNLDISKFYKLIAYFIIKLIYFSYVYRSRLFLTFPTNYQRCYWMTLKIKITF
jgi:hypothetical protein